MKPALRGHAGALLLLYTLSGCIAPAFTAEQYRHKASEATDQVASALALIEQAVTEAARHRLYLPPVEVAVGDASEAVESVTGAMASVKPPDDASEALREKVLEPMERAEQAASSARIALQRGHLEDAEKAAGEAGPLADELEALSKELEK
jgi:hypothetical protein